jgi:SAM-dependent methyltransferase
MGTAALQGELWGARPKDWTELGEGVSLPAYDAVFRKAQVSEGTRVLDLGCGAGGALLAAQERGVLTPDLAGLDASSALLEVARARLPGVRLEQGDLEELPFNDDGYDLVTGFNSFQFAGDVPRALREAARVARPGGAVAMCVWGLREECESVLHSFAPVMALLPPPPTPLKPAPPLGTPGVVEDLLRDAGLEPEMGASVEIPFLFRDAATAWRCFSSAGIMVGAIRQLGEETVRRVVLDSLRPFTRRDGSVLQENRFRWVLARKPA